MSQDEPTPLPPSMSRPDEGNQPLRVPPPQQGLSWFTWLLLVVLGVVVGYLIWQERADHVNSAVHWRTDYEAAMEEARTSGKPMLLNFTADWCPPCKQMKRDVWNDMSLAQVVHDAAIPVLLDVDRPVVRPLSERYGVAYIPTIILVDARGNELRRTGPMSRNDVREFLGLP